MHSQVSYKYEGKIPIDWSNLEVCSFLIHQLFDHSKSVKDKWF